MRRMILPIHLIPDFEHYNIRTLYFELQYCLVTIDTKKIMEKPTLNSEINESLN